jgi:hypothetical protein
MIEVDVYRLRFDGQPLKPDVIKGNGGVRGFLYYQPWRRQIPTPGLQYDASLHATNDFRMPSRLPILREAFIKKVTPEGLLIAGTEKHDLSGEMREYLQTWWAVFVSGPTS